MAVLKNILVLNGGSSSIKARLFRPDGGELRSVWHSQTDLEHAPQPFADLIQPMIEGLWKGGGAALRGPEEISAAGHRIVHGGKAFRESTRVTPEVKTTIAQLASFAPEHNLLEVEGIEAVERVLPPGTPQLAVFDTAFHSTLPPVAYTYPGPYDWLGQGIRRYGFHGISHQYVSSRAAELLGRELASLRMITCHLGNGCSLAAIRDGRCVQTTMGFTPLDGLMMGTRSGAVDPGILIHLVRHCGSTAEDLDRLLNKQSGLLGISGVSGDMREVLAAAGEGNARARLAFDLFIERLSSSIGSLLPALGGLDALVFTAGIGEHSPEVRRAAVDALEFLGLKIDAGLNEAARGEDRVISANDSAVKIAVVRTEEELEIAREVVRNFAGLS
jgi:acetate kinase